MLLEVENLTKTFKIRQGWPISKVVPLRALDGITFHVDAGEALGIVGESGCGKSTAARALLRLEEPDGGRIEFNKQDVIAASSQAMRQLRRRMQMVFQDPASSLDPKQKIGAALAEPLKVHGLARGAEVQARVQSVLEEVGLPPTAVDRYPHEFSGGQRQRIGIARALVLEPELIIADEPVSALDVSVQAQILLLMARLKESRRLAFIFVSHDLGVVRYFCERTVVMYLGRIIESGPTAALFDTPKHPYTQLLRSASPVPDPAAAANQAIPEGEPPSPIEPPSGCHFHPRCPLMTDVCRQTVPQLRNFGGGRTVACHHAD